MSMRYKYKLEKLLAENADVTISCALCPPEGPAIPLKDLRTHVSRLHDIRCHRSCHFCFGQKAWQKGDIKFNSEVIEHRFQCATILLKRFRPESEIASESGPIISENIQEDGHEEKKTLPRSALWRKRVKQLHNTLRRMEKQAYSSEQRETTLREQFNISQQREAELIKQFHLSQQREIELREQLNASQKREVELWTQLNINLQREKELREQLSIECEKNQTALQLFHENEENKVTVEFPAEEIVCEPEIHWDVFEKTQNETEELRKQLEEAKLGCQNMQDLSKQLEAAKLGWQNNHDAYLKEKAKRIKLEQNQILSRLWR